MNLELYNYEDLYKTIVLGQSAVGKTSLLYMLCKGKIPITLAPTIGVEFTCKCFILEDNIKIKAQIWDTSGKNKYRSNIINHINKTVAAMIVFDVTNRTSFSSVEGHLAIVRELADPKIRICLVGNKLDCLNREVSSDEGIKLAAKLQILYAETSIKNCNSIKQIFILLMKDVINERKNRIKQMEKHIEEQAKKQQGSLCPF